jgi:hypothetical protein
VDFKIKKKGKLTGVVNADGLQATDLPVWRIGC